MLMVLAPGLSPRTIPLPDDGRIVLGRGADADVQIADGSLSRAHAAIHVGPSLLLEDLGSANGTRIQPGLLGQLDQDDRTAKAGELERRLTAGERVVVRAGTTFRIGAVTVAVQTTQATAPTARTRAVPSAGPTTARAQASVPPPSQIIADEPAMVELFAMAERAARRELPILILGETGTGKEVLAETIWRQSPRAGRPLLRLNCGALSSSLLESELFGYRRGAFTGADRDKPGLVESADGGTVFLDEIGDAAPEVQTKLLRVLDQGEVMRLGALEPKRVDVRFLAATHRDLEAMVAAGTFRADFFYRISSVTLRIPPLRERRREIARYAERFAHPRRLTPDALTALDGYDWPGNIRQLRNVIEAASVAASGEVIDAAHLALPSPRRSQPPLAVPPAAPHDDGLTPAERTERDRILTALTETAGNQTRAARLLGISRGTLYARLDKYGIRRPQGKR